MERRGEPRAEVNAPAVITELGSHPQRPTGGIVQDISGTGMRIRLSRAIACNAAVRVETGDMLYLGEAVRCQPDGEGFCVALMLRHSLTDLPALDRLNRALMGDAGVETTRTDQDIYSVK
jgi:hypothetical protein